MKKILQILDYIFFRICDSSLFFGDVGTIGGGGMRTGFSIFCGIRSFLFFKNIELSFWGTVILFTVLIVAFEILSSVKGEKWYHKMYDKYRCDEDWSLKGFFIQLLVWCPFFVYLYALWVYGRPYSRPY